MDPKPASPVDRIRAGLLRYRGVIVAAAVLFAVAGVSFLLWSQKKARDYDEAFRLGMNLWKQGESERALPVLRKAAAADPRDPELWVTIGRAESATNHGDRALEAWEEALRREPEYKPALFERGKESLVRHIARRLPMPVDPSTGWLPLRLDPGAAEEMQRIRADLTAAEFAPEFSRFARGGRELMDGRYRTAEPGLRAYAEANGWDAGALALLGIARFYGAHPRNAERSLSDALALREEKLWIRVRAQARYVQGNYEGAKADFAEAGVEKEAGPLFARRIPSQGLILWLRADAGVELAGSSVSRWADQSDGKHDAVPREPAGGPRLTPSAVRGHPAVAFVGKDDELRLPDGFEDFGSGLSVFVVGEPPTSADPWSFVSLGTSSRGALPIEAQLGRRRDVESVVYSVEDLKSFPLPYIKGPAPIAEFEEFEAVQDSSGAARLFKRGVLVESGTLALPSKMNRNWNRLGYGLKGRLAEVLLYNRSLSDLERLGAEAYLGDRYFPGAGAAAPAPPTEKR